LKLDPKKFLNLTLGRSNANEASNKLSKDDIGMPANPVTIILKTL
jgi:hypothetical protein